MILASTGGTLERKSQSINYVEYYTAGCNSEAGFTSEMSGFITLKP